jgi:hypothetical protein
MEKFHNNDDGYFAWLSTHPNGFVLNIGQTAHQIPEPYNHVLHRATCWRINNPERNNTTEWVKVCSENQRELTAYGRRQEGNNPTRCKSCNP